MDKKSFLFGMLIALIAVPSIGLTASLITTSQIADNSITSAKIAAGQVKGSDLSDNAITKYKIATGAVAGSRIADNAVVNSKMADNSVDTSEIVADAVTIDKLNALEGNFTVDLPAIAASACTYVNLALPGAGTGDFSMASPEYGEGGLEEDEYVQISSYVVADDTVRVAICNQNTATPTANPPSQTWRVVLIER